VLGKKRFQKFSKQQNVCVMRASAKTFNSARERVAPEKRKANKEETNNAYLEKG
jgi:hypothetical protein